jgi:hypothetical protein
MELISSISETSPSIKVMSNPNDKQIIQQIHAVTIL